jgi:hypothetical protein
LLIDATSGVTQTAPGLLAWIEAACDWELNRREGVGYELQPPEAAIPPEEDAVSVAATMTMRATFAQDSRAARYPMRWPNRLPAASAGTNHTAMCTAAPTVGISYPIVKASSSGNALRFLPICSGKR